MRKVYLLAIVLSFVTILVILFVYASVSKKIDNNSYYQAFHKNYKIFTPELPNQASFAKESTPLEKLLVLEKFDREVLVNTYWHNSTILLIKRANRWFPVIEPILKENNIPDDFKYLALIESGLTNVISPKEATGFWQFRPKTAKEYGLEVNEWVDERYHVEKSTEAACKYFEEAYNEYQSWTLAAASYNAGNRRISESLEKQQIDNYYDLYLNDETARYVFRILAIKTIYENPTQYGFYLRESDLYPIIPVNLIEVTEEIPDLVQFCKDQNINYQILKKFNPWLRSSRLPAKAEKIYRIKIPNKEYLLVNKHVEEIKYPGKIFNDTIQFD